MDEEVVIEAEMVRVRNRGAKLERRGRNMVGDKVDVNKGNIKMSIPPFKGMSDPETYLEWEKKVELIFDCYNYSEEKKVKITILEVTDYKVTWWYKVVTKKNRNME